ncbi:MAG: NUDIX hydrolase [Finegoldia sp.]|nr:NUDIX hydrolase [Finegoldia sp.]
MLLNEKTLGSKMIYQGRILNLRVDDVQLLNGKKSKREIVEHKDAVCILAVKDEQMYFVRQFRKAVDDVLLEAPAGLVEAGESAEAAARREMREELGFNAENLEFLFEAYTSPGFSDEKISFFYADGLYEDPLKADDDEFLEIKSIGIKDCLDMIFDGKITDLKTASGIFYLARKFKLW